VHLSNCKRLKMHTS